MHALDYLIESGFDYFLFPVSLLQGSPGPPVCCCCCCCCFMNIFDWAFTMLRLFIDMANVISGSSRITSELTYVFVC